MTAGKRGERGDIPLNSKRTISLALAACLALSLAACGNKADSEYEVEIIAPERTSAPAPSSSRAASSDVQPTATPQAGFVVGPLTDMEITGSLADYSAPTMTDLKDREQLAFFTQNGKTGVIDLEGNIIVPAQADVHWCPVCGITNADESAIYNEKGEVVGQGGHGQFEAPIYYDAAAKALYLENMDTLVSWDAEMLDTLEPVIATVVTITPTTQEDPNWKGSFLNHESAPVIVGEAEGYMLFNPDGTALTNDVYQEVQRASSGTFAVKKDGRWGYVNEATGEQLVDFQYLDARPFNGQQAAVKTETGWGYISLTGRQKTRMDFLEAATASKDGTAWVKTAEGWGVIQLSDYPPEG